jgi:hypothetical protein
MSSTNRGAIRNPNDLYITPDYTVDSLLPVLDLDKLNRSTFCEPCRATGAIYDRVEAATKIHAEISEGIDYLTTPFIAHVIITNPPFSLALEFLQKSLLEAQTVIYLLRLNFLGSQARRNFWQQNRPSHVLVLSKRPSFTGGGTDSTEYAWFCWDGFGVVKERPGVHVL